MELKGKKKKKNPLKFNTNENIIDKNYLHSESKISPLMICWWNNKGTSSGVTYPYLDSLVKKNSGQLNIKIKDKNVIQVFLDFKEMERSSERNVNNQGKSPPYKCPVTSLLILDPNIMTFPAYLFPPMCEHELINTLPWRPCNSISSLNLLTKIGPKTPHLRSRDPCEHTKTYEAFNDSGFPGSHSPSLTRTSSTNVSTSKWVNLLQFH